MVNKKLFKNSLLILLLVNILSFAGFYSSAINWLSFIFILAITAFITWKKLEYGVLILLAELMVSSQGHLFDLYLGSFRLSLRMGIFIILILIPALKFLIFNSRFLINIQYLIFNIKKYYLYLLFGLFIIWGVINGLLNQNNLNYLYQDVNGYLFFLLLPVFITVFKNKPAKHSLIKNLLTVWLAATAWQFIVAVILLFLYGHLDIFWRVLIPIYAWFRDLRIIEVGLYNYNFYRIFMQSQIWLLTGFFVFLHQYLYQKQLKNSKKTFNSVIIALIMIVTVLIISLSRSFWLAGIVTFILFLIFYIYQIKPKFKIFLYQLSGLGTILIISIVIIAGSLLVPVGKISGLASLQSLKNRATKIEGAAIQSRWELLPELVSSIKEKPIIGNGFGATVTYKTKDPRYLEAHPNNPYYTTFAFEWGWLDIWHEMGIFGLLTYLLIICSVIIRGYKHSSFIATGLTAGLVAIVLVNIFTPFLNHPLAIGYLLLCQGIFQKK